MFQRMKTRWTLIREWITKFPERRPYTISSMIQEENALDDIEIEHADRAIVNHQYLKHMAQARKNARDEWIHLQEQRNNGDVNNVKPLPVLQHARIKRQA
jgi:hypothetical protein